MNKKYIKVLNKNSVIEKLAHAMLEVRDTKGNYIITIPPLTSMTKVIDQIKHYWKQNFDVYFVTYVYGNIGLVMKFLTVKKHSLKIIKKNKIGGF